MSTNATDTKESIDTRTRKAATESMTVVALDDPGKFEVYSGSNSRYVVDLIRGTCECPDSEYNPQFVCKHRQRAEMEIGERAIPDLDQRTDVEIMSGRAAGEPTVATDGGVISGAEPQGSESEIPAVADCSPKKARELTHGLAMDVAAGGDLRDWGEHRAVVDVVWSSINAAVGEEVGR